jgi:G3E family GTPase
MEFINNYLDEDDDESNTIKIKKIISSKILRSKGFFWLASRPREQMIWSQAGGKQAIFYILSSLVNFPSPNLIILF